MNADAFARGDAIATPIDVRVALDGQVVILPVRHHSPACAWHVRQVLQQRRPGYVLIEGPADGNALLETLLDDATRPPVALYAYLRGAPGRPACACWYPFCEYSPEWIALREGARLGAEVAFIDLPTWWMLQLSEDESDAPRREATRRNAYADDAMRHHAFLEALCRANGCRDFDDLWDHLIETRDTRTRADAFWSAVATYGAIARRHSAATVAARRDREREAFMAEQIRARLPHGRPIVVVTGSFHRAGVLERLAQSESAALVPPPTPAANETGCYVMAYGYAQLDRWSGYQAGMPAPAFYERVWSDWQRPLEPSAASASLLHHLARQLRTGSEPVSTADLIAAETMPEGLRRFRGHGWASSEDLRDAVRSTFVKETHVESARAALAQVDRLLVGARVGAVAPSAGLPPIVRDFQQQLHRLGLPATAATDSKRLSLDLYARGRHRQRSAFLHQLRMLEISYAELVAGPDFVKQTDTDRVREIWEVNWRPEAEAQLLENALLGETVADAAARKLLDRFEQGPSSLSAKGAVELLTAALVMGMDRLTGEWVSAAQRALEAEGSFGSCAQAFGGLAHLLRYRPVLEGSRHLEILHLSSIAFDRAILLIESLPGLPVDSAGHPHPDVEDALSGLTRLRHAVLAEAVDAAAREVFFERLERVYGRLGRLPLLHGAVLGVLRQAGRLSETELTGAVTACLHNTVHGETTPLGEFLRGLFQMTHHGVVTASGILEAVHDCIRQLSEERFRQALPGLRWAFTSFAPREVHQLCRRIARLEESRSSLPGSAGRLDDPAATPAPPSTAAQAISGPSDVAQRIDNEVAAVLRRLGMHGASAEVAAGKL